jgi:N-acetyl-alpha-D-glucosaminyl L-malate synthase BshA
MSMGNMSTPQRLKIGMTCYPSVGGSGVIASMLGIQLAKLGHEVHFISYERPFRLPDNNPRIYFHPVAINSYGLFKYPDYTLPLSVEMARVSCAHDLDILHVHYAVPHATAALLALSMLPEGKRPKVVTTLHGTDTTLLGHDPGYKPIIRHSLIQSDAVTAVSRYLEAQTREVFSLEREIVVIPNFYAPLVPLRSRANVRAQLGVESNEVLIIHSSNLRPPKRIDLLLQTVARIVDRQSFKLLILAGADFSPFADEVKRLDVADRVLIRQNVLEIEEYLQAADIGLYTSETESFCLSILEGMFFGCPSVSTNVGGIPEVVNDGVEGLLADFGDLDKLARALDLLIADAEMRDRLAAAALNRAQSLFTATRIVPMYEALYRRLCSRH